MIKGKGVSVGIGFGNIVILKNEIRKIEKNIVEDSDKELERFHKALEEVINETNQIVEKARGTEKEISYVSELFSRGNSGSAGGRQ